MQYIVLDMEWNQPVSAKSMVKSPVALHGEIIQIGAVKLNEHYHILDTFKIMVAPKYYRKMHQKVAKLTSITTDDLQYGFPFPVAFRHFQKWCGEDFAFLTWGADDIAMLRDNLSLHKLDTDWIPGAYNLQVIFDHQISQKQRQVSLSSAMELLGEPALKAHDALNDAKNTVRICLHLDMARGLEDYEQLQQQFFPCARAYTVRSESAKSYDSYLEALSDPELVQFYCPYCGEMVTCTDIVRQNVSKFITLATCPDGHGLFVRFKFTRWQDGKLTVSRILYELDDENKSYYLSKKQKMEAAAEAYALQKIS